MALPPPQRPAPATAPAAVPPASPRRRWVLPVVLAVVGVGLGVLVGALAFGGDDDGGGDELAGGAADAADGCRVLSRLPDEIPDEPGDAWSFEGPYLWRLQALTGAFAAAAAEDREYRALGDDAMTVQRAYARFDTDEANEAFADLRDWCADHVTDD